MTGPSAAGTIRSNLRGSRNRILVLVALIALPWSIQFFDGAAPTLRFVWGMASLESSSVSSILLYVQFNRASIVFDWVLSGGFLLVAAVATLLGAVTDRQDGRIAAGSLVLAGLANLSVVWTFSIQPARSAVPIGSILVWYVAWRWWRSAGSVPARE